MKPSVCFLLALVQLSHAALVAAQPPASGRSMDAVPPDEIKAAARDIRRVLAVYWYPSDHPVTVTFDRQFEAVLKTRSGNTVERYAEYFESSRFPGESQARIMTGDDTSSAARPVASWAMVLRLQV